MIAGLVASPFHGNASLYAMRLTSIVICGVLFALTLHLTNSWARTLWPTLTCLIAALPTTIYSTTLAAPNGTNMITGMALWAALLHRIKKDDSGVLAYLVMCASAALLVNTHTLGAVWFALTIVACSCLVGPWKLIALVRPRTRLEAFAAMGAALATVFEFAWLIAVRPNDPAGPAIVHTNVWTLLPREMLLWPLQAVGAYPYRDEPAPTATYAAAALVLLPVLVIALRAVPTVPRLRMTVGFVVLTSYAVPIGLTVATFSRIGLNWQGRYGMPYAVGFFLLLGLALDHAGVRVRRVLVETGIALWVVADVVSQSQVLTRQGSDPVLARTGWWVPSQALIMVLGLGAWLAWRRIALEPRDPSSGNRQPFRRGDSRTAVT